MRYLNANEQAIPSKAAAKPAATKPDSDSDDDPVLKSKPLRDRLSASGDLDELDHLD